MGIEWNKLKKKQLHWQGWWILTVWILEPSKAPNHRFWCAKTGEYAKRGCTVQKAIYSLYETRLYFPYK